MADIDENTKLVLISKHLVNQKNDNSKYIRAKKISSPLPLTANYQLKIKFTTKTPTLKDSKKIL
jgi:hypothetical protein